MRLFDMFWQGRVVWFEFDHERTPTDEWLIGFLHEVGVSNVREESEIQLVTRLGSIAAEIGSSVSVASSPLGGDLRLRFERNRPH